MSCFISMSLITPKQNYPYKKRYPSVESFLTWNVYGFNFIQNCCWPNEAYIWKISFQFPSAKSHIYNILFSYCSKIYSRHKYWKWLIFYLKIFGFSYRNASFEMWKWDTKYIIHCGSTKAHLSKISFCRCQGLNPGY